MSSGAAAAALCVLAGLAGSVQIAVMARLGERVGIVEALAFASVLTGVLATLILLAAMFKRANLVWPKQVRGGWVFPPRVRSGSRWPAPILA